MARKNRDEFPVATKRQIAKRAGWLCSYPTCRAFTVGATSDGNDEINIGTAAHICAAAPGGPRFDPNMTHEERSSANNGIWMCRDHGKAVDSNDPEFTVERLREWKHQAQRESWQRVMRNDAIQASIVAGEDRRSISLLRCAAQADLKVFQRTANWPNTSVALSLDVAGHDVPMTTDVLARAVATLDDLILVAPPGMGKTTTLFQIAEGALINGSATPIVVPLGDWATEDATIVASILARPAFRGISEDLLYKAAAKPGVILLLDGWNELDAPARRRARVQVNRLKAELPEMGLLVTTRRQSLDVPFGGTRVEILPLNDEQQIKIAIGLRGNAGARMVDQAWRTAGVRELVTIPLYLTALLALPEGVPFPATKEEVLRRFVTAHEKDATHAEALHAVTQGFQQEYLDGLAVFATRTANTAIADTDARRCISETETMLAQHGQITIKTQPDEVLEVLVASHMLMRAGDTSGVSFQHQQFQEWYASHSVEDRIVAEVNDPKAREALKAQIFDLPTWEEAILFAVERLARGDAFQQGFCGNAILAAFEVDPLLAAEMIFRATDEVWMRIAAIIRAAVGRWHAPGTVDRAIRFMLTSGRPEFFDLLWPLITHENDQISLKALRNCRRFKPSVLGKDAARKIKALPQQPRMVLLEEMASHSAMDGLDLAADIAKDDPDPEVQSSIVEALAFRRAHRHVSIVLKRANDGTFDRIVRKGLVEFVEDSDVQRRLVEARKRVAAESTSAYDRLRLIVYGKDAGNRSVEVTNIITAMDIDGSQDAEIQLIHEACKSNVRAVAKALLAHLRAGSTLFYDADDILAAAGFVLEDEDLYEIAMAVESRHSIRAEAAASVLGPKSVGRIIDAWLEAGSKLRKKHDQAESDRYYAIQTRIAHAPGASLVAAIRERSDNADNETLARLADLLFRNPEDDREAGSETQITRGRPFNTDDLVAIRTLVEDWGNRMLASGDARRDHLAQVARLMGRVPSADLLPLLKRMLDDNLRRYCKFREQAQAANWLSGDAVNEARQPMTLEYQRAFLAIDAPETAALMKEYLYDEHFGQLAAQVLASRWRAANQPRPDSRVMRAVDFRHVEERRVARVASPNTTSDEAEAIFAAIENLIGDGATDVKKQHAISLAVVAAELPHGQRQSTIQKLVSLAPRRSRAALLLSFVMSGHVIEIDLVKDGLAETMEAGKSQSWIFLDGYEIQEWLRLLPFTDHPGEALTVVQSLPAEVVRNDRLEVIIEAFGYAPGEEAEKALLDFADVFPQLQKQYAWRNAVFRRFTESAAKHLVDWVAGGGLARGDVDSWLIARQIGVLIDKHSDLRQHIYTLLNEGSNKPGLALLAKAVAENPDADGLLLLLRLDAEQKRRRILSHAIQRVVTKHVPIENWEGAYNIVPVPAVELRRKLLLLTTDGGRSDGAARYLNEIDRIRDEYGAPEIEPRHPDLGSGKTWPIMIADLDGEGVLTWRPPKSAKKQADG